MDLMTSQLNVGDEVPATNEAGGGRDVTDGRRTAGHPGGEGRGQICRAAGPGRWRGWEGGQQLPQLCLPAEDHRQTSSL